MNFSKSIIHFQQSTTTKIKRKKICIVSLNNNTSHSKYETDLFISSTKIQTSTQKKNLTNIK